MIAPPLPQDPPAADWDLTVGMIDATVQIDQPLGDGNRTVGTAFLIQAVRPDGSPRVVLVTAAHVLDRMAAPEARVGWREAVADGGWRFDPQPLRIRDGDDRPLWTRHPERDIAVMEIVAPEPFARAAIPLGWLADQNSFAAYQVGPADELLSLGFPRGLSGNRAGFPILRVGRIASYPLVPVTAFPAFLLDFTVFPGNSGGPVFWTPSARRRPGTVEPTQPFIAGMLTQEVLVADERLDIGVVTHAQFIRETVAMLDQPAPKASAVIRSSTAPP